MEEYERNVNMDYDQGYDNNNNNMMNEPYYQREYMGEE